MLKASKVVRVEGMVEVYDNLAYYNESNRASVFYAESWAVVHFLMLDEDDRQKQMMKNFLTAWTKSGNQLDAAREAFGDLKQFGKKIESYARQGSFRIGVVKAGQGAADKSYTVRGVSPR